MQPRTTARTSNRNRRRPQWQLRRRREGCVSWSVPGGSVGRGEVDSTSPETSPRRKDSPGRGAAPPTPAAAPAARQFPCGPAPCRARALPAEGLESVIRQARELGKEHDLLAEEHHERDGADAEAPRQFLIV